MLHVPLLAAFPAFSAGPVTTFSWSVESNLASAHLGPSVAPAGDVNGAGLDDTPIGAYNLPTPSDSQGRIFLFGGSSTGPPDTPRWTLDSQPGERMGTSFASADINDDGQVEVVADDVGNAIDHCPGIYNPDQAEIALPQRRLFGLSVAVRSGALPVCGTHPT